MHRYFLLNVNSIKVHVQTHTQIVMKKAISSHIKQTHMYIHTNTANNTKTCTHSNI